MILDHFGDLLAMANRKELVENLTKPVAERIQAEVAEGLFRTPVALLVYWLVTNHAYEVTARWPVPGLEAGLNQVKAHLGVG
ncbi:MAG: hypothetical protein ACT6Q9_12015 [Polaromonas sp.]